MYAIGNEDPNGGQGGLTKRLSFLYIDRAVIASSGGTAAYASDIGKSGYTRTHDAIADLMSLKISGYLKIVLS